MKVSALTAYVDKKNRWNAIFKGPQLSLQSFEDRVRIAQSLDSDLSPENLSCDGELPRAEVNLQNDIKQNLDEEYYPLVDAIRANIDEYTAMDEQQRLAWVREYFED